METKIYKYIEIKKYDNGEVVKRLDVTDKPDRTAKSIEDGMNRNLNHNEYYTFSFDSETQLPTL